MASFASDGDYDSARLGDGFVRAVLRAGNVHTASGAVRFIREAVSRASGLARTLDVRLDAGFKMGRVMDPLTEDGIGFIWRLKTNSALVILVVVDRPDPRRVSSSCSPGTSFWSPTGGPARGSPRTS